jgi:hypothetical protein
VIFQGGFGSMELWSIIVLGAASFGISVLVLIVLYGDSDNEDRNN